MNTIFSVDVYSINLLSELEQITQKKTVQKKSLNKKVLNNSKERQHWNTK